MKKNKFALFKTYDAKIEYQSGRVLYIRGLPAATSGEISESILRVDPDPIKRVIVWEV